MTVTREVKHVTEAVHSSASLHRSFEDARFGRCTIHFYPPSFVWSRLQELHRASLRPHDRKHLSPAKARSFYDAVRVTSLAQLWVGSDSAREVWFEHLLDAIAHSRSFDGLETAFLSGLNTAALAGQHASVTRAIHLWRKHGPPAKLGGGHKRSPVLDTSTNAIVFLSQAAVASLGPHGKHRSLIDPKVGGFVGAVQGAGIADAAVAQDGDSCEKYFKAGGAVAGMILGGIAGGVAGSPTVVGAAPGAIAGGLAGGGAGATIGGALGGVLCPGIVESDMVGTDGVGGANSTPAGDPSGDPGSSIMFGDDSTGSADAGTSGQDSGQTSSDQSQSSSDQSQSSSDSSGQSGDGTDSSGSGSGNDGDDSSGGMPDPDDPGGFPSPDDPHGRSWISDTCAYGSVAAYMSRSSNGAWTFSSVPRLAANGQLASAGFLGAIPAVAARVSESQTQANGSPVDKGALGGKATDRVATP